MPNLSEDELLTLLRPFVPVESPIAEKLAGLIPQFSTYLDLLLRWNARTNLTAVREPREIVQRHFGESIFAASAIAERAAKKATLLDLGSGAGFPGLPIQLCLPELDVTLAESQGKKASFLREAVRVLELPTAVWASRVEQMPLEWRFDIVTLRAVDRMEVAMEIGMERTANCGMVVALTGGEIAEPEGWGAVSQMRIPASRQRFLTVLAR